MSKQCNCHSELVKARAHLAYLKALPSSSFPAVLGQFGVLKHSIHVQRDTIQCARANVVRLEVLQNELV